MSLVGTEMESIQRSVEKAVLKYGSTRESVMNCAVKCILNKYDKRKMADKLASYLDSSKASKLASKLNEILYDFEKSSKKRSTVEDDDSSEVPVKRAKFQEGTKENTGNDNNPLAQPVPDAGASDAVVKKEEGEEEDVKSEPAATPQLSSQQIKEMMANAQRLIMERKKALENQFVQAQQALGFQAPTLRPPGIVAPGLGMGFQRPPRPAPGMGNARFHYNPRHRPNANFRMDAVTASHLMRPSAMDSSPEATQKIMELQAEIKSKMSAVGITVSTNADVKAARSVVPPLMPESFFDGRKKSGFDVGPETAARAPTAPQPGTLLLDDRGRMIDSSGNEIQISQPLPELKANLRAVMKKKEKETSSTVETGIQSTIIEPKSPSVSVSGAESAAPSSTQFFDPRVNMKSAARTSRRFTFHDPGKYVKIGNQLRMKAQLEKVQAEINALAKKTGISSVTKLALATSSIQKVDKLAGSEEIPDVEWWDVIVLKGRSYGETDEEVRSNVNENRITHLIEHPTQLANPGETPVDPILPVFLTKKEQKKKRRQNRREAWKEKQEKIRLGLEPPPEPRMTMSNLMRVLGTDAVQDPTKVEAHVREQMAKRQKTHQEANAARKLTKEQKREKKKKKILEDVSAGVHVALYRVKSLSNPSKKFKVETNVKQLHMTGCVVLHRETNVVVVEGGPKQQKKFKRVMLSRIKWSEDKLKPSDAKDDDKDDEDESSTEDRNKCVLVWEGVVKERSFGDINFKFCPTESFARDFFKKKGVEHYWDLAYSGAVLEAAEEDN